jgi:omega-6 fatty acid desaturase (delta-12 desaturase)
MLFVIGHDACHGSFFAQRRLNQIVGRLALLPSLHPFSSWHLGHNQLHHCWTNLKGKDYVWTPLSPIEFARLTKWRKLREKVYRSIIGVGFYYMLEIWWKHMIWPRLDDRGKISHRALYADLTLVWAFFFGGASLLLSYSIKMHSLRSLFLGAILPQFVWNWLMGFVVFLHHTHPNTRWYANKNEWIRSFAQIENTVHVIFPRPVRFILHNITEHTAHHVDPRIPLYHLVTAQKQLSNGYGTKIVQWKFTLRSVRVIFQQCQLYDYEKHFWLSFDSVNKC